ncbi:probable receptor-like serine/threonine-protein kinase At4g34500 [Typha angustifolia]|uniref:probable receptor-like serine/threonine-protein kinase At4g34500 n=1 Tax=Typha angustifolia TaxID=59011 RepID=UPI003C2B7ED5
MAGEFLAEETAVLGLKVYALIAISAVAIVAAAVLVILFLLCSGDRRRWRESRVKHSSGLIPISSKEAKVIEDVDLGSHGEEQELPTKEMLRRSRASSSSAASSSEAAAAERMGNIGWGRWYSMAELEDATGCFSDGNVIGEGGYGVVYRGVLPDLSVIAIKNLLDNKGQAEKEFKVEVEAIGKVRHKNLVGLIGYCAEGPKRMLVYQYIDNGNLEQWLHGDNGRISPLTWDTRMKIAVGTAKGIAYLHEGLEPKVVHRDIKSSNILLDKHWNAKVSDFGLAKLLGSGSSYVTTRVMGTFGYVAPEYASTGMLNEGSDIYSFGVLLMEIISGRSPVDYRRPAGEVNLVDWFKGMVGSRRVEEVVDPLIREQPSPRALKRVLLVCLRCIDSDAEKRPKMGQIVHMLEGDEFPFRMEHRSPREANLNNLAAMTNRLTMLSENVRAADSERTSMWR